MNNIFEILKSSEFKERLSAVMPDPRNINRFLAIATSELRNNPRIASCEIKSLCGAIVRAAQLGLELDSLQGHAYLTARGGSCQLIIGYKGMIALGFKSKKILTIEVQKVCANDFFEMEHGDNKGLRHRPCKTKSERGEIIGYYAYASLINGGKAFEYMNMDEIEELKEKANVTKMPNSPWVKFEEAICKKTVVRQLFKYLSMSPELDGAIGLDEMADAGVQSDALVEIGQDFVNVEPATPEVLPKGWERVQEKKEVQQDLMTSVA